MTVEPDNYSESELAAADDARGANKSNELPPSALTTLQQMEKTLTQIHGAIDASARDDEHRHFSTVKTVGAILQVVVGGLLALALLDWILGAETASLMTKLAFATVLQLCALTAFVVVGRMRN